MVVNNINRMQNSHDIIPGLLRISTGPSSLTLRSMSIVLLLVSALFLSPEALASEVGDFLGRRVMRIDVVIEGAPNANTSEMKALIDVAPGQDYSPVRIHDSLVRLYRSGLIRSEEHTS